MSSTLRPLFAVAAVSSLLATFAHAAGVASAGPLGHPTTSATAVCHALSGREVGGSKLVTALIAETEAAPAYCRVSGTIAPKLNFEIRLPQTWNSKLYYGGGGGYNGVMPELVVAPLVQGYAQVVSDSGHQDPTGMSAAFVEGDQHAARLFGSEAVPAVMATTLQIISTAYGSPPSQSYFEGCSTGGREALMAVQRNPDLFDGVIARAPAFNWVGFMGAFNAAARAAAAPGAAFGQAKAALLARHVRDACDGLDGLVDGVVSHRAACTPGIIRLETLRCVGGGDLGDTCLSDAQLALVRTWTADIVFNGVKDVYSNRGYPLSGNEDDPAGFGLWATGNGNVRQSGYFLMQDSTVQYYLAKDRSADSLAYIPWDRDPEALEEMAALNDATNPDIRAFIDGGGKLIVWQGGSDAALSVESTIDYMTRMKQAVGPARAEAATRFYVAPGVNHCGGGAGPDQTDLLLALDRWVMNVAVPETLVAQKLGTADAPGRSMPLCRYPRYPRFSGRPEDLDATKLAANFTCSTPVPAKL
ncbi:tannase/feruloyl esterase family alpha/beta hydrolase [Brevundimonas sp. SL130]|uniref:tannase/feruloyl esterase family alpha/beta hydrolase n=1 Tax=Brevundimonas sp. SL130 TaxID=2995143 RepID=UPI00226CA90E|nr:tannase/feruloyl esterase family alpha/beta hydrolase [Brevundimonas sp. SL130]WAC60924.1 tannase/feruloyl esterase family alpha/beta hydrolase [Brevundimonas sp. SL130]